MVNQSTNVVIIETASDLREQSATERSRRHKHKKKKKKRSSTAISGGGTWRQRLLPIGLLCVMAAAANNATVAPLEPQPGRRDKALQIGARAALI